MIRMGVSGCMFLLVPAYPGCPGSKAVKRSLLLLLLLTKTNNRPIIGIGRLSADANCQMADTDYRQTGR